MIRCRRSHERGALKRTLQCTVLAASPVFALALAASAATAPLPQEPAAGTGLAVTGEDGKAQRFDEAALSALPQRTVRAEAHGKAVECRGPDLIDVLAKVGAPTGDGLRGKNLALYVRASAADGYRVVFALAELDRGMREEVLIITASCNGKPLDAKDGPFRLIVPGEKRPARWIRQVTAIDLLRAP